MSIKDGIYLGIGILVANIAFNLLMVAVSQLVGLLGYGQ